MLNLILQRVFKRGPYHRPAIAGGFAIQTRCLQPIDEGRYPGRPQISTAVRSRDKLCGATLPERLCGSRDGAKFLYLGS